MKLSRGGNGKTKKDSLLLISALVAELHGNSDYDPLSLSLFLAFYSIPLQTAEVFINSMTLSIRLKMVCSIFVCNNAGGRGIDRNQSDIEWLQWNLCFMNSTLIWVQYLPLNSYKVSFAFKRPLD